MQYLDYPEAIVSPASELENRVKSRGQDKSNGVGSELSR